MNGWGHGWDTGWGAGGWFMIILGVVFVIALVVGIVYLIRALSDGSNATTTSQQPPAQRESPKEILQRRYAAGEIDREEYQRRLTDLSS